MKTNHPTKKLMLLAGAMAAGDMAAVHAIELEEVVVTATKREQSLQELPIAVTNLSAELLNNAGVANVEDTAIMTPGLSVGYQGGGLVLFLRGVGGADVTAGQESAVSIYVDGVYMPESYANVMEFNNIERIEVLRGPQGTLFGRNATGGLLNIVTKDPGQEPTIDASFSYGNYDTLGIKLYGATGITDDLAADLAVNYSDQGEGWGVNLFNGKEVGLVEDISLRSKWLYTPGENTRLSLALDYSDISSDRGFGYSLVEGTRALLTGDLPPPGFYDINTNVQPDKNIEVWGVALNIQHSLDWFDIVSITSYRDSEVGFRFDNDITPVPAVDIDARYQVRTSFSQELQFVSADDGRFTWIAGLFYLDDEAGFGDPWGLSLAGVGLPSFPAAVHVVNLIDTRSYAVFGEGTYEITADTRVTLGARWTKDERELDGRTDIFMGGVGVVQSIPNDLLGIDDDLSYEEPTYRIILDHNFSDDVFGYASFSRGFRSGNFNTVDATNPPFEPETLDAWEIGLKTQWLERRLTLNVAAYDYSYEEMQFVVQRGITQITDNAAESSIRGLDIESSFHVSDNFKVFLNAAFIDAEYDAFPDAAQTTPIPTGGNALSSADASGNKIMRTPDLTLNTGFNYRIPTDLGDFDVHMTYYYNDGFYWHPENRLKEDAYHLVNSAITWSRMGSPFSASLWGRNLLDEEYATYVETGALADQYSAAPPLTFGIALKVQY